MSKTDNIPDDGLNIIGQLTEASATFECDDLATLAKMHGWCTELHEITSPSAETPCPQVCEQLPDLCRGLEELILGETDDPAQTRAKIVQAIEALSGAGSPETDSAVALDAETPATAEPSAQETDEEVAVKLANVFGNDEPAAPSVEAEVAATIAEPAPAVEAPTARVEAPPPYEQQPLMIAEKELEFVKGFVEEAYEHIESVESAVLEVEKEAEDSAKIDDLFRPFHTIKGMAGFLNLRDINCLTHEVETLLDQGRKGQRKITAGLIDQIFEVVDVLKVQIDAISGYIADPNGEVVAQPPVTALIDKLRLMAISPPEEDTAPPTPQTGGKTGEQLVAQNATSPAAVEWALEEQQRRPDQKKVGEILVEKDLVTPRQVSQAIRSQSAPEPVAAAGDNAAGAKRASAGDQSVRIETSKLDALVDMVGELVIAQTLVATNPTISNDAKLTKDTDQVAKIVRDVQELAMAMRMVPIGPTFQRMARLVRDVSRKAGKNVQLSISGEDTELDKNVIQQIGDPLVHMVRNAVDHGIEQPADRSSVGKDKTGHVHLNAFHQGGNIIIQIQDDGKGLDRDKLIAKAIEKGIVHPGEELTDEQAYALIFAPGFSTAAEVTDISGRGVGMDVVRRNIEQLRGRTEISSETGKGSTFSICLPLTLAIIDGMVIGVGGERFVLPTIAIEQSLRPKPEQISTVQQRGEVLQVRGELIPLVQLGQLFGLTSRIDPCKAMVIIAQCEDRRIGLVVTELIGQQQVVIKSLGERFQALRGISGAAILGDGHVGLILETIGLAAAHRDWRPTAIKPVAPFDTGLSAEISEAKSHIGDEVEAETTEEERLATTATA